MIDISIIIPTYNRLWSLSKTIDSCINSKLDIEIIVIDDESTDGTWEWINKQPHIISIRQEKWGKPWAVNYAFRKSSGKYIKFLDSDDWLPQNVLEKQFKLIEEENTDVVVAGYYNYLDEVLIKENNWFFCDDFIAQQLGECDSSHYSAFLFRKSFIEDIPHRTSFAAANFASRDDRCFMLEVSLKNPKISFFNNPALCHRHHQKDRLQF